MSGRSEKSRGNQFEKKKKEKLIEPLELKTHLYFVS